MIGIVVGPEIGIDPTGAAGGPATAKLSPATWIMVFGTMSDLEAFTSPFAYHISRDWVMVRGICDFICTVDSAQHEGLLATPLSLPLRLDILWRDS